MTERVEPAAPAAAASGRDNATGLALPQSTALVLGTIIGVGVFNLPSSLASIGPRSM